MKLLTVMSILLVTTTASAENEPGAVEVLWDVALRAPSFGSAATVDVDGDGHLEIAFATYFGDSAVYVLNGEDGSEVWKHQGGGESGVGECFDASLKFADLDGDGNLELVVPVSNTSLVLAFDAASGAIEWTYEAGAGECIDTPPTIADIDGDGLAEIAVGTFKGKVHLVGGDGKLVRTVKVAPGAVQSGPTMMDLDGDEVVDIVAANFKGDHRVHAVSIAPGEEEGEETELPTRELWSVQTGSHIYHGCSVGDLDEDGEVELVSASYDGKVYAIRQDGSLLWTCVTGERYIMAPTVIADVDDDGVPEVIATSEQITVMNADGEVRYRVRADPRPSTTNAWPVTRGVAVADLDGDGGLDFAYVTGRGFFRVIRGRDGAVLYEFDAATLEKEGDEVALGSGSHCPIIADFDGDGMLDVFFVTGGTKGTERRGRAVCLTGFAGTGPGWYMFRHDQGNSGNVLTPLDEAIAARIPALK